MKLASGCILIRVNFDPIQEIEPEVGGGHSFESGLDNGSCLAVAECVLQL